MQSLAHQDQRNEKNKFTRILQQIFFKRVTFFKKLLRHFLMVKSIQACIIMCPDVKNDGNKEK